MRYTKIHTQIWNDEKFIRLSPEQQRLFLYILTSPHSNIIGYYVLKKTYIQGDLEVLPKDLAKDLAKLCSVGLISYDDDLQMVLIHNWVKHNPITNPNQKIASHKILKEMPKSHLFERFKVLCEGLCEGLPKDLAKPYHPEEEEETETEEETEDPTKRQVIPYEKIKDTWNTIMRDLDIAEVQAMSSTRKSHFRQRWMFNDATQSLEWWEKYFTFITESDFLMGRTHPNNGKKPFRITFDWAINETNFLKIKEGNYHS